MKKAPVGIAALFGTILSSSVMAQEITPYECPTPIQTSVTDAWMASEARNTQETSGSKARNARGKTYNAFMDVFWAALENDYTNNNPETVGAMLDQIGASYVAAFTQKGRDVKKNGVTPILEFRSFRRGTSFDMQPEDLKMPLSKHSEVISLFASNNDPNDDGVEINIRFHASWGYIIQPLANGLARYNSVSMGAPAEDLLGDSKEGEFIPPYSYWDEINIKDNFLCKPQ